MTEVSNNFHDDVFIGFGANLPSRAGDPRETFAAACDWLVSNEIEILSFSSLWLSAPVPRSDQSWFTNAVARVRVQWSPEQLILKLKECEYSFGRTDFFQGEKMVNQPRELDLDLIAYGQCVCDLPQCRVPHPRMAVRGFVLLPLYEIAPYWQHPVLQKNIATLVAEIPSDQENVKSTHVFNWPRAQT
jgi:2-amino-4-hydroxy-6-hydroxymethyldihydropteridine diphosphokinase